MQTVSRHAQSLLAAAVRTSSGRSVAFAPARLGVGSLARQSFSGSTTAFKPLKTAHRVGGSRLTTTALFGSMATAEAFYDFKLKDADGKTVDMSKYKGKVVLIVNVASQCGFTPQYKELASLYDKYSSQGFVILGFPCNQFGGQEPGSDAEVKKFAQARGAKFPIMSKVDVNGSSEDPLFSFLKAKQGGLLTKDIKWNFTKFLVDREGNVVKRYGSSTTPLSIEDDVKKLL